MNIFVDTSVWSLALRRESSAAPEVEILQTALAGGDMILTTGIVLQELLQGFQGPKAVERIIREFSLLPIVTPDVKDHIEAARLRNTCRRSGAQVGTIDALIAQLCIQHELSLLSTDKDFEHVARFTRLALLNRSSGSC